MPKLTFVNPWRIPPNRLMIGVADAPDPPPPVNVIVVPFTG